jgi:hypothetical protein
MFGYAVSFILIFLTHPGVAYNFFDPGISGGLFQAVVISILQLPSDGRPSFALTMGFLYWLMLGIWAYVKVRLALMGAATGR